VAVYVPESFTADEADVLRRYFTNLDGPVFALVNLPEVVKGALFARYSRSPRACAGSSSTSSSAISTSSGDHSVDATIGLDRAEELYERVFFEYGDDSVAQLGGVHLACEQASNLLTKILEWGRLMSYLEQSTRYIAYDARLGGRYRYYRDPECSRAARHPLRRRHRPDLRRLQPRVDAVTEHVRSTVVRGPDDSEFVYRTGHPGQGARRHTRDPAGGAAVERRDLRHRSGVRGAAVADAGEPVARGPRVRRPDAARAAQGDPELPAPCRPPRTWRPMERLPRNHPRRHRRRAVADLFGDTPGRAGAEVELVDFDPDAEDKLLAAICYAHSTLPEHQLLERVRNSASTSGWR
jgi:thymidylate synthase ThyX